MKKSQSGFSAIEILGIILIVGLIILAGLYLYQAKNKQSTGTLLYGTSTFTKQGPTDAAIGTEPASATVLIGAESSIRKAMKPVKTEEGGVISYEATESDVQSSGSKIVETSEGDYKLRLKKGEDVICLVRQVSEEKEPYETDNNKRADFVTKYILYDDCRKPSASQSKVKIDIRLIGFGSNRLECLPESDCARLEFKYD